MYIFIYIYICTGINCTLRRHGVEIIGDLLAQWVRGTSYLLISESPAQVATPQGPGEVGGGVGRWEAVWLPSVGTAAHASPLCTNRR